MFIKRPCHLIIFEENLHRSLADTMSLNIVASTIEETKQGGDVISMVFHKGKLYTGAEGGKLIVSIQ